MVLKTYNQYNESVRDQMTPKSEKNIREEITKAPIPNQFIRACQGGYLDIVKKTLQSVKNSHDYLSLVYVGMKKSVEGGFLDIFKYLVDNTELNFLHWNDEELLRSAIENEYTDMVEYLYSLGANTPKWTEKSLRMNESIKDLMTPKSKEEIDNAVKLSVENFLDVAHQTGYSRSRVGFFLPEYKKYLQEYILSDGLFDVDECYLLYRNSVYKMSSIPGGDYYTQLNVIPETITELKVKLKDMLNKLG